MGVPPTLTDWRSIGLGKKICDPLTRGGKVKRSGQKISEIRDQKSEIRAIKRESTAEASETEVIGRIPVATISRPQVAGRIVE